MSDKEIEVNGKKYGEESQVTLKAKTLIWIIGALIAGISSLATIGYFDIKSDLKEQKEVFDIENEQYINDVKSQIQESLKEYREKREEIIETIGEVKGDIKVILDRTSRNNNHNNNDIIRPVNNTLNTPDRTPPSRNNSRDSNNNHNSVENSLNLRTGGLLN